MFIEGIFFLLEELLMWQWQFFNLFGTLELDLVDGALCEDYVEHT